MVTHQSLELRDELSLPAERKVGFDSLLERGETKLFQSRDLGLGEGLIGQVRERWPAPERQRRAQHFRRLLRIPARPKLSPLGEKALEALDVELLGLERQHVPASMRHEVAVAEELAQLRDVDADAVERAGRHILAPEGVDQAIRRHRLAGIQEQHGEQRALLSATQLEPLPSF